MAFEAAMVVGLGAREKKRARKDMVAVGGPEGLGIWG